MLRELEEMIPPLTKIIHENLSVILTFAYSYRELQQMLDSRFRGEWKYLRKTINEVSGERATRACIELANILRILDDREKISQYLEQTGKISRDFEQTESFNFGRVLKDRGLEEPLYLRDFTNKIIHAADWRWDFTAASDPKLVCLSHQPERWKAAEIQIEKLAGFCGQLMH
jgi:hypothetical protein